MSSNVDIKVSVIVPVYNMEDYLSYCLNTLINQSLKNIEIIIINDCSTDNSHKICEQYRDTDERIVLINNDKNIKQGLSRNKGIELAKGEFIGFVDPDDFVDLDFFEKLYYNASINKTNIAKAAVSKVNINGSVGSQSGLNGNIARLLDNGEPLCMAFHYEHWSAIYRRDLILRHDVKYANLRNAEDNIFLLKATFYLRTISIVNNTVYYYRQHDKSTEASRPIEYYESILHCFKLHLDFINELQMEQLLYDKIFLKGFDFARLRYLEIIEFENLGKYSEEYFSKILDIVLLYKYDFENILKSLHISTRYLLTEDEVSKSTIYFLAKIFSGIRFYN